MHLRILKMIASCGFLTALDCTKFVSGTPDLASRPYRVLEAFVFSLWNIHLYVLLLLTALPRPLSWL